MADFLWLLSFEYQEDDLKAKAEWLNSLPDATDEEVAAALRDYLDLIFLDKPSGDPDAGPSHCSGVASMLDFFVTEYRWTIDGVLDTPLPRLFQLQRAALIRKGHRVALSNRLTDRAKGAYLQALNAIPEKHRQAWHEMQAAELKEAA